ncbi:MAG: hypothetical protein CMB65_04460 [Euryarchaeota archaeon]|nr:hypothetical protein [Euryarchaeota archaeon]
MALVLNDRVKETTTTTGTGTVNLAGAETGFETFVAGIGNTNTCYYAIVHQTADEFEVGLGTVADASPDTLARTTVISSSNSDSAVNFSSGTKDVFCTMPASKAVHEDASGNVTLPGTLDVDGGITVDNITIDGTEIDLSSGDLTIDVAGDIILDANGADINLKDNGTIWGSLSNDGTNFMLKPEISDGDFIVKGNDDGSEITALRLDMSQAGRATFNENVKLGDNGQLIFGAGDDLSIYHDTNNSYIADNGTGDLILDSNSDITIDAGGEHIRFKDDGTEIGNIDMGSQNLNIRSTVSDKDIVLLGNDGGSEITALTLDMSAAGAATFNDNVTAYSDERLKDNIETLTDGLDKVEQLRGVTYTRDERENIGVIAQEVEKILPEIVLTADDEMGTKSVDYSRLTAVLIEAVKDLSARVKELEGK